MNDEPRIVSVEQTEPDAILVHLVDGTVVEISLGQLLQSGIARYPARSNGEGVKAPLSKIRAQIAAN